jgi:hypothetical protein
MGRFETEVMSQPDNLGLLVSLSGKWIGRIAERRPMTGVMLDMDSSVSPTHGDQKNTAYNGHFGCTCYHPLFVFNQFGDLERCALRPGNVHSADGWRGVLEPVVTGIVGCAASFTLMPHSQTLRSTSSWRLRTTDTRSGSPNQVLQERIADLFLKRPVGRPPIEVQRYYAVAEMGQE